MYANFKYFYVILYNIINQFAVADTKLLFPL